MESIVGIFNSLADARRGAAIVQSLGIPANRITVLSPHTSEAEIEAHVATSESEQPGMGSALGGTVGAAVGVASGGTLGAAAAMLLVPGVGPVLAFGVLGAAILGAAGAAAGAVAGGALEESIARGLPRDELYVYEDALRRGRSLLIAFANEHETTAKARTALNSAGAESIDAARDEWWIGLRGAEQEHSTKRGGDFRLDEAKYRLGFEASLNPDCRARSCEDMMNVLKKKYGDDSGTPAFREGYDRGQRYLFYVIQAYETTPQDEQRSRRAA